MGEKDEEVQQKGITSTLAQCMYRYNTKAKIPLNNRQTPKQ
jgi:hypothetical protein